MGRPLLTPVIRAKRFERCQMLVDYLKSTPAGRVIIFSMRKLEWAILCETKNDRYLSLREEDESARALSKTKYPALVMSLCFVAFNGAVFPLIWTARDYEAKLADKFVPWINNLFDMSSVRLFFSRMAP